MAIPAIAAAAAVIGAGYGVASGVDSSRKQKNALGRQKEAQQQAESGALKDRMAADRSNTEASKIKPNLSSLLGDAKQQELKGAGSTLLTGPEGIDPKKLQLARTSLLGR